MESRFLAFLQQLTGFYTSLIDNLAAQYNMEFISNVLHDDEVLLGERRLSLGGKVFIIDQTTMTWNGLRMSKRRCWHAVIEAWSIWEILVGYLVDVHTHESIARYREQRSERNPKDFFLAQRYYEKAFQLLPGNGNPMNQLAVIATYYGDDLSAAYYYFRRYAFFIHFRDTDLIACS